jgi:signal peptidase I
MSQTTFVIIVVIALLLAAVFSFLIFWGTLKLFRVAGVNLKKVLIAFSSYILASTIVSAILSFLPSLSEVIAMIAGIYILYVILKKIFAVKFWKSVAIYFVFAVFLVVAGFLVIIPIRMFVAEPFYMKGPSMEPTYKNMDYLVVNKIDKKYQRGDVIIFRYPKDPQTFFIQRIVALPGEKVEIKDGAVFVNGAKFEESYLSSDTKTYNTLGNSEFTLGGDEYFVLGDNRNASKDSRMFGALNKGFIIGKIWFKGWPLK